MCNGLIPPDIGGLCPIFGPPVCACDGGAYANECEAFFENDAAVYYRQSCANILQANALDFACGTIFTSGNQNWFASYTCSPQNFEGRDLFLRYNHAQTGDLQLDFEVTPAATVFLVDLDGFGSLNCLGISENNQLLVEDLLAGDYYLVVDAISTGFNIEFCNTTSTKSIDASTPLEIQPNPAKEGVYLKTDLLEIEEYKVFNPSGQIIKQDKKIKADQFISLTGLANGLYFIEFQASRSSFLLVSLL